MRSLVDFAQQDAAADVRVEVLQWRGREQGGLSGVRGVMQCLVGIINPLPSRLLTAD